MSRKWLESQVERWIGERIIDRSQAERILSLYPEEKPRSWGPIIFAGAGTVIFGLGVILLFAYNWERIPKFAKLAAVFASLAAAHAAGIYFRARQIGKNFLPDAMHLLGTMLFGAGIWLVAQIYHIDEHYPNGLLIWGLGALFLAWALPSISQGVGAAVLFVLWGGFETFDFRHANHYAALLITAGIFPLAFHLRSLVLVGTSIPAAILAICFTCSFFDHLMPQVFIFTSTALIALGIAARKSDFFPESSPFLSFYGSIIYFITLFVFTFPAVSEDIFRWHDIRNKAAFGYFIGLAALASASWLLVIFPLSKFRENFGKSFNSGHLACVPVMLTVMFASGWLSGKDGWVGAALFNIIFLFHSIYLISSGCRNLSAKSAAAGTVMLGALAFARYADLFDSLLVRGLVFILVGAAIFAVGIIYWKRKSSAAEVKQ